jgi:UDP-GlcNAc3NAcA epimerase
MKVFTVVGARPQFIKAAPVCAAVRQTHQEFLVHTGQHYDVEMSEVFFQELGIPQPDANLGVGSGGHGEQTGAMLAGLERLLLAQAPDWVLLYGDTNSTLAGALAASKLNIKIAHVEAGLRSYNRSMPEEINRVLTDHVSDLLFCPTPVAQTNLAQEGITRGVHVVGDVMVDGLLAAQARLEADPSLKAQFQIPSHPFALATIHRPANTDNPLHLSEILTGLGRLTLPVIFPAHPRLRGALQKAGLVPPPNVSLIPPASYLHMIGLLANAQVVITDSGGLQKEAYVLARPCVTVRPETEWVETVETGWNRLCGPVSAEVVRGVEAALAARPTSHPAIYGDGQASQRIVATLEAYGT